MGLHALIIGEYDGFIGRILEYFDVGGLNILVVGG